MRAKIANEEGFWHGLWLTHYNGASTAELDLGEFFVNAFPAGEGKNKVTQTIHLHNNKTGQLEANLPKNQIRYTEVTSSVQEEFHIYSVSVEPNGTGNEATISFWVDNKKTISFSTNALGDNVLNKFISDSKKDGREMNTWNIMFQGGVGSDGRADVGYPDPRITSIQSSIDYIRVFTLANTIPTTEAPTTQAPPAEAPTTAVSGEVKDKSQPTLLGSADMNQSLPRTGEENGLSATLIGSLLLVMIGAVLTFCRKSQKQ